MLAIYRNSNGEILRTGGRIIRSMEGLYTTWEIDELIAQGWIPVATGAELNALRTTTSQTMGAGTIWQGTYTTGADKQDVQVDNIDLTAFENFSQITSFVGKYDGNELLIKNFTQNVTLSGHRGGLFDQADGDADKVVTIVNVRLSGNVSTTQNICGGLMGSMLNADSLIDNCIFTGTVTGAARAGGLLGQNGGTTTNGGTVSNSQANGTVSGSLSVGGLIGAHQLNAKCINSNANVNVSATSTGSGGLIGTANNSSLTENCFALGDITTSGQRSGGLIGEMLTGALCKKSYATGNVSTSSTSALEAYAAGLIGVLINAGTKAEDSYATGNVEATSTGGRISGCLNLGGGTNATNCYSTGKVIGSTTSKGGFSALGSGSTINCYWDKDSSEITTSVSGQGRTTLQMKQGTADSFILPGGGVDGDSLAANAMYTGWSNDVWEFTPDNEYPKLK